MFSAQEQLVRDYYAPVLLGTIFSTFLYGVNVSQFAKYAAHGRRDYGWTHMSVVFLFVTDTIQEALAVYSVWDLSVQNFGDYDALLRPAWPTTVALGILMALIASVVQQYFIWRVKTFSRSWPLFCFLSFCSFASGVVALVNAGLWLKSPSTYALRLQVYLVETSLGLAVFVNLVNAFLLLYYLLKHRSGFKRTDSVVRRLIVSCVETPLLNALISLVDIIVFKATLPTTYVLLVAHPMGRVYTFSLLALLNSQVSLREDWHGVTDLDTHSMSRGRLSRSLKFTRPSEPVRVGVTIEHHAQVEVDPFARTGKERRGRATSRRAKTETTSVGSEVKEREHELDDFKITMQTLEQHGEPDKKVVDPV